MNDLKIPMIGFSAYSGTGKTTTLKQVIPLLKQKGLRVAVIKHAHHDFDLDIPGKDSYELRKAGSDQTIICTTTRMAVITEFESPGDEPELEKIVSGIDADHIDLILVEGYKHIAFPKIELHRKVLNKPYLYPDDPTIFAIACDTRPTVETDITVVDINDIDAIADMIVKRIGDA